MRHLVLALLHLAQHLPGNMVDNFIMLCLWLMAIAIWIIALNVT
jgi:hypothetical protein